MKKQFILIGSIVLLLGCSGEADRQYAEPNPPAEKIQDDFEVFTPMADILFVVDDSGSMHGHQQNLISNISAFTDEFTKGAQLDYHIGVVTTDTTSSTKAGRLVGLPAFVTPKTVDKDLLLKKNLNVGTVGSGTERPFDAAHAVFSQNNVSANKGFIRPAAALAVIFITDAEDQSSVMKSPQKLYDFLVQQKGNDPRKVLGYGALVIPDEVPNCHADAYDAPNKIFEFLKMVVNAPNNDLRLCAHDFGRKLSALAQNIVSNAGRTILLTRLPWVPSIKVMYGSAELPSDPKIGWTYDGVRNAIILADGINWDSQPQGSQVKVFFDAISPK